MPIASFPKGPRFYEEGGGSRKTVCLRSSLPPRPLRYTTGWLNRVRVATSSRKGQASAQDTNQMLRPSGTANKNEFSLSLVSLSLSCQTFLQWHKLIGLQDPLKNEYRGGCRKEKTTRSAVLQHLKAFPNCPLHKGTLISIDVLEECRFSHLVHSASGTVEYVTSLYPDE